METSEQNTKVYGTVKIAAPPISAYEREDASYIERSPDKTHFAVGYVSVIIPLLFFFFFVLPLMSPPTFSGTPMEV